MVTYLGSVFLSSGIPHQVNLLTAVLFSWWVPWLVGHLTNKRLNIEGVFMCM